MNILSLAPDGAGPFGIYSLWVSTLGFISYVLCCFVGIMPHASEHSNILSEKSKTTPPKHSHRSTSNGWTSKAMLPNVEPAHRAPTKRSFSFDSKSMFNDSSLDVQFTQQTALSSIAEGADLSADALYPHSCENDDVSCLESDEEDSFGSISKSLQVVLRETEYEQQQRIVLGLPFPKSLKKSALYGVSCFQTGEIDVLLILSTECYIIIETKRSTTKQSSVIARKQAVKYCKVFEILRPDSAIIGIAATYSKISVVFDNGVQNSATASLQFLFQFLDHNRCDFLKS